MIHALEFDEPRQRLPVAAMIDMVFLVVFYFLAVGALGQETSALELQLADASGGGAGVVLEVSADGGLSLSGEAIVEGQLRGMLGNGSIPANVYVRVHDSARHDVVTRVLETITLAGGAPQLELLPKDSPTPSPAE